MYRIDEKLKRIFIESSKLDGLYKAIYTEISNYGFALTDKDSQWTKLDNGNKPLRDCLCSLINKIHNKNLNSDDYCLHHKNSKHDFNDYRNLILYPTGELLNSLKKSKPDMITHKKLHTSSVLNAFAACLCTRPLESITKLTDINYKKNKEKINIYIKDNIEFIFNFYIEDLKTYPYSNFGGIDIEKYF